MYIIYTHKLMTAIKIFFKIRNEAAKAIRYAKRHYECRLAKEAKTNKKAI